MGDGTLTHSARIVIAGMLTSGVPTIERLSAASGMGVRTIQRRLHAEGRTFSDLLESLRRDLALAALTKDGILAGEIAMRLGYTQQSSFTRAVRRWTGTPPTAVSRRFRA
jgi:AraC-like DNA-binding protein